MKKILLCASFIAASFAGSAQVGIGTTTPDASAALDITSTTKGLLTPRMTQTQRNAISSPSTGLIVWCTNCGNSGELQVYNGTTWTNMIGGTASAVVLPTSQVSNGAGGFYTFLSHNLGADTSLDPYTPVQGLNGDYYQWGKNAPDADVDNLIGTTWGDQGGTTGNGNWTPDAKGLQDPCPAGYRVPSSAEWVAVNTNNTVSRTGTFDGNTTEFGNALHYGTATDPKQLTLPAAGNRSYTNGALGYRGDSGSYWSSAENGSNAYYLLFSSSFVYPAFSYNRAYGFSLRCIAE
jgi:uncharacterized protein (TIGR02145 family)